MAFLVRELWRIQSTLPPHFFLAGTGREQTVQQIVLYTLDWCIDIFGAPS
jgi:hypothetical protein